ncbi:MAG TPA: hypothetical protein VK348_06110 [Planctomycetota bacterium]|nr:hypothetical protein [Planctomycetota bacterium]
MQSKLTCVLVLSGLVTPALAQSAYETGFETLTATAAGVPMAGQDGYFVPPVAGSLDQFAYTYAGNILGVPANPNGGAIFIGSQSLAAATPSRTQRAVPISADCRLRIDFDICCNYIGPPAVAPVNNIGSVSTQPSTTARVFILLARWAIPTPVAPTTWNADIVVGPTVAGAQITVPDPNFQGLANNIWHRWGCTVDFVTNEYTELRILDGSTGILHTYLPPAGTMPLVNPAGTLPTDYRIFTGGGLGNVLVVDNVSVAPNADTFPYGAGCNSHLGVPPTLDSVAGSRPVLGGVHTLQIGNPPSGVAFVSAGFSNTLWTALNIPLPADLSGFGLTGCNLLADPLIQALTLTNTWSVTIPNNLVFAGIQFYNQAFCYDPGFNAAQFVVSNGTKSCVGR